MPQTEHEPPFEAYQGEEPFVFVSYAHKDSEHVYPDILRLHKQGHRIWYDEGIDPGNEWPEDVANALNKSAFFLVYISPNAVESRNVRNEIHFALNDEKPFLAIHIQETQLPPGLRLRMGDIQAVHKYMMSEDRYFPKLDKCFPAELLGRLTNNKVFLSYASSDRDEVLRRIQVLNLLNIQTYLDITDLQPENQWKEKLRDAIDQSKFMILFWSEAASQSKWVEFEWRYALKTRGLSYIRPLPLCLPGQVPPPKELADLHFNDHVLYLMNDHP